MTEAKRAAQIPPEIRPSAGKLKVEAFASLMYQANMGGSKCVNQFIFVFPLIGSLSQRRASPFDSKAKKAAI